MQLSMLGDVTDPPVNVHICTRVWLGKSPLILIKYLRFLSIMAEQNAVLIIFVLICN